MNGWVDEPKLVYHPIPVRPNQTEPHPSRKSPALLDLISFIRIIDLLYRHSVHATKKHSPEVGTKDVGRTMPAANDH